MLILPEMHVLLLSSESSWHGLPDKRDQTTLAPRDPISKRP